MLTDKRFWISLIVFALAVLAWASTIFWIPSVAQLLLDQSEACASLKDNCREIISIYGATGDIFGSVTSLFSGLALFAVAMTLWLDSKSRRESRKPLVVATLVDNSAVLLDPSIKISSRNIYFSATILLDNQTNDAALNSHIKCVLVAGEEKLPIPSKHLATPLIHGDSREITVSTNIADAHLQSFLSSLTQGQGFIELHVEALYQSLESVDWITAAVYQLRCGQSLHRERLNAVRAETAERVTELWANGAQVPLEIEVKDGSWTHKKRT